MQALVREEGLLNMLWDWLHLEPVWTCHPCWVTQPAPPREVANSSFRGRGGGGNAS